MKQIEATVERPFYSVCYEYKNIPWKLNSFHHFNGEKGATMCGTDDKELAIKAAGDCLNMPGVVKAYVFVTTDCYNHQQIYQTK